MVEIPVKMGKTGSQHERLTPPMPRPRILASSKRKIDATNEGKKKVGMAECNTAHMDDEARLPLREKAVRERPQTG